MSEHIQIIKHTSQAYYDVVNDIITMDVIMKEFPDLFQYALNHEMEHLKNNHEDKLFLIKAIRDVIIDYREIKYRYSDSKLMETMKAYRKRKNKMIKVSLIFHGLIYTLGCIPLSMYITFRWIMDSISDLRNELLK